MPGTPWQCLGPELRGAGLGLTGCLSVSTHAGSVHGLWLQALARHGAGRGGTAAACQPALRWPCGPGAATRGASLAGPGVSLSDRDPA